jgi:hypothetical protein
LIGNTPPKGVDSTDQETGVATDIPGIEMCKYFKILIDWEGEG